MYPMLEDYFPIYSENYIPGRKFFWQVFGTLFHDDAKRFINMEREKRYTDEEEQKDRVMMISPEILNEIEGVKFFSKKKGRALFKMSSKAYPPIARKRKNAYSAISEYSSPQKGGSQDNRSQKRRKVMQGAHSGDKEVLIPHRRQMISSANKMNAANDSSPYSMNGGPSQFRMSAKK